MSKKRLFQVLDEMNVNDEKNKTATLPCALTMVEAKSDKRGGLITMGVEPYIVQKIFLNELRPMLVVLDMKEYHRIEALPVSDELQTAIARAERAERALQQIRKWELPNTGKFWDNEMTQPMSYEACYGSNGARDYFRNLANHVLNGTTEKLTPKTGEDEQR